MKKLIFIATLIVLLSIMSLLQASQFACPFLFENQSIIDAAFGLESGTAGLRNLSPYSVSNNPAKLGALNGFSYEFATNKQWKENYAASAIIFGFSGIGIRIPFLNADLEEIYSENIYLAYPKFRWDFGVERVYGAQEIIDANGNLQYSYKPYERNLKFAIGINASQNLFLENYLPKNSKLYLGYAANIIYSYIWNIQQSKKTRYYGEYALLFEQKSILEKSSNYRLDCTFGLNYINPSKETIQYIEDGVKESLPTGIKTGISSTFSHKIDELYNWKPTLKKALFFRKAQNVYTIYTSLDYAKYDKDRTIIGSGIEFCLLDAFSYRFGYTYNAYLENYGFTYSFGTNITVNDNYSFSLNYINSFKDSDIYTLERTNLTIKYNF